MNTHFKSALNQIKAEEELLTKTERFLRNELNKRENPKNNELESRREFFMKKRLAIAVSLAVILIGGGGGSAYAYYQTPQSYISLDINPSVELGVNAFDKVVDVEAYNSDGEKILTGLDLEGSDVSEAVNTLVSSAEENGYVAEDGSTVVSVTSETDDEELATELEEEAEAGANEALVESGKTATINKDNIALARRDEARSLGITPGKLNLINKLQAVDPTATVEQYKDASVKEIMKAIKEIKHNSKVSDENEVLDQDQNEVIDENQNIDETQNQDEQIIQNQDADTKQNQGKEKDKTEVKENKGQDKENNKNQNAVSNKSTNANNNAKNTTNGNNGNSDNKGK